MAEQGMAIPRASRTQAAFPACVQALKMVEDKRANSTDLYDIATWIELSML